VIERLSKTHLLGVVINCYQRLGLIASIRIVVEFEVIVSAERAGYYKPHPAPYPIPLDELNRHPGGVPFVAGSAFDLVGTARVELDTYWHNRVGLKRPEGTPPPLREARSLEELFSEY
jgi:2-haloacid dehalogenase